MRQLTQNLKNGAMKILEVPFPAYGPGQVLVRNHYSVISTGTEGKTVKDARLGYIGKARSRQKEVKQVLNLAKTQGVGATYRMVKNKLEAPSALGYSCAGEIVEVGSDVRDMRRGDLVACGGASASHAEIVAVPKNLCVRIPEGVNIREAAFSTIAAIAMQGVRQADLRLGESCLVIGLGLIGQITIKLLAAAGVRVVAIDIDPYAVKLAAKSNEGIILNRKAKNLEQVINETTDGHGTDAVIITASSSSTDPVDTAGIFCRKKGKVVIVGAVPTGFSRQHYYRKELDLRMSSSYGPGRYDPVYEEKGIDYPIGYVRWTEQRNMKAFTDLLAFKKISLQNIITHEFEFMQAEQAYQMILDKSESFMGITLKYDIAHVPAAEVFFETKKPSPERPAIGLIGTGSFAQNMLLPRLKGLGDMVGVASAQGNQAVDVAGKYGFSYTTADAGKLFADEKINTIFIVTPHNLHADFVIKGLQNGKNVFVEKPLAMNLDELVEIKKVVTKQQKENKPGSLMVGYNRRFAPQIIKLVETFPREAAKAINMRVNAGQVPREHWVHDPETGGGRIIGEVCHFVDLCMYLAGAPVTTVAAEIMDSPEHLMDTLIVNLAFANGSIASISYFSNGSKLVSKEFIEVFYANQTAVIDDFKTMTVFGDTLKTYKNKQQDKGHSEEIRVFLDAVQQGNPVPIPFNELFHVSLVTFKIIESAQSRKTVLL